MCDHYLEFGKLLKAIVAITTILTCDEPSTSFKFLQFSTLIPAPLCTITYTYCLISTRLQVP